MKRILLTTALVAFTTTPLMAQTVDPDLLIIERQYQSVEGMQVNVSNLMGRTVYIAGADADPGMDWSLFSDIPDGYEDVADVSDIMIDSDGNLGSVILDVGGFLGMGETEKAVSIENLMFVADTDDDGEYFVVFTGDRQVLEDGNDYDAADLETRGYRSPTSDRLGASALTTTTDETVPVAGVPTAPVAGDPLATSPVDRSAMTEVALDRVTAEMLEGTPIYGVADEHVGEIGTVVLSDNGDVSEVIVDVGGFLGIGERNVAMSFNEIALMEDGGGMMVGYISMTEEQVEALEEWNG